MSSGEEDENAPELRGAASARVLMSGNGTAKIDTFGNVAPGDVTLAPFMVPRLAPRTISQFNSATKSTPPYALLNGKVFPGFNAAEFLRFFVVVTVRALHARRPLNTTADILTAYLDSIAAPKTPAKSAVRAAVRSFSNWHESCKTLLIDESHCNLAAKAVADLWRLEDELVSLGAGRPGANTLACGPMYAHIGRDVELRDAGSIECVPIYREIVLRRWYKLRYSLAAAIIYADAFPMRGSGSIKGAHDVRIHHDVNTIDSIATRIETIFAYVVAEWHELFMAECVLRVGRPVAGAPVFVSSVADDAGTPPP